MSVRVGAGALLLPATNCVFVCMYVLVCVYICVSVSASVCYIVNYSEHSNANPFSFSLPSFPPSFFPSLSFCLLSFSSLPDLTNPVPRLEEVERMC